MFSAPPPIVQILMLLLVLPAAVFDFRQRRVPNWITLPGVLLGVLLNWFLYESAGLRLSLKGLGLALLVYVPFYLLRGMGAGDVKLMAAVGAFAGPANWFGILILTSVFGAAAGLLLAAWRGRILRTFQNLARIVLSLVRLRAPYAENPEVDVRGSEGIRLPHAVAIAAGTTCFLVAAAIWSRTA